MTPISRQLEHLEEMILAAATEKSICDALLRAAVDPTRSADGIELDEEEARLVQAIREDLLRFGGNPNLHSDDAKSWSLGVLISANARTKKKEWIVHVTSIQRALPPFAVPDRPEPPKPGNKKKGKGK